MLRKWFDLVVETYQVWRNDRTMRLGAGLAYYGLFAFIPILALAVALATVLFKRQDVQEYLSDRLVELFGPDGQQLADLVNTQLVSLSTQRGLGLLGVVSLLLATSLFVLALQDAFNTMWKVPVRVGFGTSMRRRLRALLITLTTVALLTGALAVHTAANVLELITPEGTNGTVIGILNGLGTWAVLAVAMVLLFRYFTPVKTDFRMTVFVGVLTAVLASIGTWAYGVYLREFGGSSITGVAGSLLLAMVWIYYEVQIVLAGGQLVRVAHQQQASA